MGTVRVTSGLVMGAVGIAVVLVSVAMMLLGEQPLPVAFAVVGLVMVGAGMRRHRVQTGQRARRRPGPGR